MKAVQLLMVISTMNYSCCNNWQGDILYLKETVLYIFTYPLVQAHISTQEIEGMVYRVLCDIGTLAGIVFSHT